MEVVSAKQARDGMAAAVFGMADAANETGDGCPSPAELCLCYWLNLQSPSVSLATGH